MILPEATYLYTCGNGHDVYRLNPNYTPSTHWMPHTHEKLDGWSGTKL